VSGSVASDNAEVLRDLALSGLGIVRLLGFVVEDAIADGRLVPLLTDVHASETVPISALMPPGRQRVPRIRAFVDFVAEACTGPARRPGEAAVRTA
jgi:DNA-binding transcriptional LysR family regulator